MKVHRYPSIIFILVLIISCGILSCSSSWKNWKIFQNAASYQIRADESKEHWVYLKKKRDPKTGNDFQQVQGPFKGQPPSETQTFVWNIDYLDTVFGNQDSIQFLKTIISINQRKEQELDFADIRIFNDHADMIGSFSLNGIAEKMRVNAAARQALILINKDPERMWTLVDILKGNKIGPSGIALPSNINSEMIKELLYINDKVLIIEQIPEQVRIHILNDQGNIVQHFELAGTFKAITHTEISKNLVITEQNEKTFASMLDLSDLTIKKIGPDDIVLNSIPGNSEDLLYKKIETKERWIYSAFQQNTDQFTIRLLDESGSILKTQTFNGRPKITITMGKQAERIVFALDRIDNTDMIVLDVLTGELITFLTMPGKYKSIHEDADHLNTQVSTDRGGSILRQEMSLY